MSVEDGGRCCDCWDPRDDDNAPDNKHFTNHAESTRIFISFPSLDVLSLVGVFFVCVCACVI